MSKITVDEKRLQNLRQQLFGKEEHITSKNVYRETGGFNLGLTNTKSTVSNFENTYIYKDLIKISILTLLAFSFQLCIYLSLKNNLIRLPF